MRSRGAALFSLAFAFLARFAGALDLAPLAEPGTALDDLYAGLAPTDPSAGPHRDPAFWPQGYYSGDPLPKATIYLSFDDGPTANTSGILDILEAEGVKASFFINSWESGGPDKDAKPKNLLLRYKEVLLRMVRAGDVIGSHGYSHRDFASLPPSGVEFQLAALERDLRAAMGADAPQVRLIRPPFGSPWYGTWNKSSDRSKVAEVLRGRGIVMLWTVGWDSGDSADWAVGERKTPAPPPAGSPSQPSYEAKKKRELDRILGRADGRASGVILMHDTHPTSRDILKELIVELKRRGYGFATLEDYCRWRWGPEVFGLGR